MFVCLLIVLFVFLFGWLFVCLFVCFVGLVGLVGLCFSLVLLVLRSALNMYLLERVSFNAALSALFNVCGLSLFHNKLLVIKETAKRTNKQTNLLTN